MSSGVYALIGVVVGGLLTGIVQWWMTRRTEQADFQAALRLVLDELETSLMHHDMLLEEKRYPLRVQSENDFCPTEMWREYRAVLARHLENTREWDALANFEHTVARMRILVEGAISEGGGGQGIVEEILVQLRNGLNVGTDVFRRLAGRDPDIGSRS